MQYPAAGRRMHGREGGRLSCEERKRFLLAGDLARLAVAHAYADSSVPRQFAAPPSADGNRMSRPSTPQRFVLDEVRPASLLLPRRLRWGRDPARIRSAVGPTA